MFDPDGIAALFGLIGAIWAGLVYFAVVWGLTVSALVGVLALAVMAGRGARMKPKDPCDDPFWPWGQK